jgi:hypothetical protein
MRIDAMGMKLPIWSVRSAVAIGGRPDMAQTAQIPSRMTQPRHCIAHTEATPYAKLDGAVGGRR